MRGSLAGAEQQEVGGRGAEGRLLAPVSCSEEPVELAGLQLQLPPKDPCEAAPMLTVAEPSAVRHLGGRPLRRFSFSKRAATLIKVAESEPSIQLSPLARASADPVAACARS